MHWCQDESIAAMSAIPVIGVLFHKLHNWYHKKTNHPCHKEGCQEKHLEHLNTREISTHLIKLSIPQIDEKFGQLATILLTNDRKLLETDYFPSVSEFSWFLDQDKYLIAYWNDKVFHWIEREWFADIELEEDLSIDVEINNDYSLSSL
jgi:hypothetical protein